MKQTIRFANINDLNEIVHRTSHHFQNDNLAVGIPNFYSTDSEMLAKHIGKRIQEYPNNDFKYIVIEGNKGIESFLAILIDKKKRFGQIVFVYSHNNNEAQMHELVSFAINEMIEAGVTRMKFEVGPHDTCYAKVLLEKGAKKTSEHYAIVT